MIHKMLMRCIKYIIKFYVILSDICSLVMTLCGLKHIGIINNINIKGRKLSNLLVEWCDWLLTMHGINNINSQCPLLPLAGQYSQHFP